MVFVVLALAPAPQPAGRPKSLFTCSPTVLAAKHRRCLISKYLNVISRGPCSSGGLVSVGSRRQGYDSADTQPPTGFGRPGRPAAWGLRVGACNTAWAPEKRGGREGKRAVRSLVLGSQRLDLARAFRSMQQSRHLSPRRNQGPGSSETPGVPPPAAGARRRAPPAPVCGSAPAPFGSTRAPPTHSARSARPRLGASSRRPAGLPRDEHVSARGWVRAVGSAAAHGPHPMARAGQRGGAGAGSAAGPAPSRRGAARGSAPQTSPTETAGVPPRLGPGRPAASPPGGRASPHALRGRRDQSASDVSLPIRGPRRAAHTPSTARAHWLRAPPVRPGGRGGRGERRWGGSGPRVSEPRSRPGPSRALGLPPSLLRSPRLPCAPGAALGRRASRPNGRPGAPISGRQGASPGAAPANRRGSRPGVGGGSTARPRRRRSSSQPAASERRASRPKVR
ncbi:hypothetical protein VULLAG_LOCUS15387 [Vulpes lagopus]